eukprot:3927362-Prymnesium_polylepis.1
MPRRLRLGCAPEGAACRARAPPARDESEGIIARCPSCGGGRESRARSTRRRLQGLGGPYAARPARAAAAPPVVAGRARRS